MNRFLCSGSPNDVHCIISISRGSNAMKIQDLTGQRFGRLLVQSAPGIIDGKRYRCQCLCDCGKETRTSYYSLLRGVATSCGCASADRARARKGSSRYNWKGGRRTSNGYVYVLLPDGTYRQEHLVVMERHLGREISRPETVHHKNGVRNDNRLDNLELWVSSHPSGQRVDDLLAWADEIIRKYR